MWRVLPPGSLRSMLTPQTSPLTPTTAAPTGRALVRLAQVLMIGPLGAIVIFGSIYFSVVAPPERVDGLDWVVGAWALASGAASIVLGLRLAGGGERVWRAAVALIALHVVFGLIKVVAYAEGEALTFVGVDLVVLALLARLRTGRRR